MVSGPVCLIDAKRSFVSGNKYNKLIVILAIVAVLAAVSFTAVYFSIQNYFDNNTWVTVMIETDYSDEPQVYKDLSKDDVIGSPFADAYVKKVRVSSGVTIYSDADLVSDGKVFHKQTLTEGGSIVVQDGDEKATLTVTSIGGY